jgi:hypothetical protein
MLLNHQDWTKSDTIAYERVRQNTQPRLKETYLDIYAHSSIQVDKI